MQEIQIVILSFLSLLSSFFLSPTAVVIFLLWQRTPLKIEGVEEREEEVTLFLLAVGRTPTRVTILSSAQKKKIGIAHSRNSFPQKASFVSPWVGIAKLMQAWIHGKSETKEFASFQDG